MSSGTSSPWWYYQFIAHPNPIDRISALIALEHPDADVQIEAYLRVIYNDWDLRFCEEVVVEIAMRHTDGTFPYSVSRAIGLLVRDQGEIHGELIYPLLEYLLQFPEMEWHVRRSLEYIEWCVFGGSLFTDTRSTAQLLARAIALEPHREAWPRRQMWPPRRKVEKVRPVHKRRGGWR